MQEEDISTQSVIWHQFRHYNPGANETESSGGQSWLLNSPLQEKKPKPSPKEGQWGLKFFTAAWLWGIQPSWGGSVAGCEAVGQFTPSGSDPPHTFPIFLSFSCISIPTGVGYTHLPWGCTKAEMPNLSLGCYAALGVPGGWGQHSRVPQQP